MSVIVQKYGGTSVGDAERIRRVAERVVKAKADGHEVLVVVSAMGQSTDDLLAMALAAAVGAEYCEIFTDVQGVFTADPRLEPSARKLHAVSYEEMLELSAAGAKVLQLRSVEYARNTGVMLHVRSSFTDEDGTWVREEDERMEQALISGVVHDDDEAKITIQGVPDRPGVAARIFRAVADERINIDMIVQNVSHDGLTDVSFTAPKPDLARIRAVVQPIVEEIEARGYSVDDGIAKISLVGAGMKSHPGVAADMFQALADEGVNIEMISTSSIRVSCVIRGEDVERAVRAVHRRFGLGGPGTLRQD